MPWTCHATLGHVMSQRSLRRHTRTRQHYLTTHTRKQHTHTCTQRSAPTHGRSHACTHTRMEFVKVTVKASRPPDERTKSLDDTYEIIGTREVSLQFGVGKASRGTYNELGTRGFPGAYVMELKSPPLVETKFDFSIRKCIPGEKQNNQSRECELCPEGNFHFHIRSY